VAQFTVARAQHGYAFSTIEQGVYALALWALELGVEGLAQALEVRRALAVANKLAVLKVGQKWPLERPQLQQVVKYLRVKGDDDFVAVRDMALFLVGWCGMFRCSELVSVEEEERRYTESEDGVMLFLRKSKTDQSGQGAFVLLARCDEDEDLCPVKALQRLERLLRRRGQLSGPVFTQSQQSSAALSKSTVGPQLRKVLEWAKMAHWERYAAHSLRRGGATWEVRKGVSLRMVQAMGRWKSDVVREYLSELLGASRMQQRA
jgi:integrase